MTWWAWVLLAAGLGLTATGVLGVLAWRAFRAGVRVVDAAAAAEAAHTAPGPRPTDRTAFAARSRPTA